MPDTAVTADGATTRSQAPVRIAFVTDIVTPYMVAVLDALAQLATLHVVFCSRTGTRGMDWTIELRFSHEIVEGLTIRRRTPDATDYYLSPGILAALHRARPEAIISGGFSFPSLYAAAYGHLRGVPVLVHSDGTARSEAALGLQNRLSRAALRRLTWGAVANSEPAAERFAEIGFPAERIFRAPHVIHIEPFWQVAAQRERGASGPLKMLFVGRLIPRKGCEWLLRACAAARQTGVDIELTVVGRGGEENRLRDIAEQLDVPVCWLGFVDQPQLPEIYGQADAFAFPTLDDPFGIVVLEAAAAGLPVIASPHGGATADLVRDGHNGFVVEPTDVDAMAAAITRLARDPELRARMGRAAREGTRGRTPAGSSRGYLEAVLAATAARAGRRT